MNGLTVAFGGATVSVGCPEPGPVERLRERLARCDLADRTDGAAADVTYRVEPSGAPGWALLRDGARLADNLDDTDLVERLVYEVTLALATRAPERLVFHAAAVARADRGILLPGPSGVGKSTLATWLAAAGLDLLSDEVAALDPAAGTLAGFPRPVNVKDRAVVLDDPRWPPGRAVPSPAWGRAVRLGAVVFPRYQAGSRPALRAVPPAEAGFRLLACLTNGDRWPRRGLPRVAELFRRVPACDLLYPDAADAVALIEGLSAPAA